MTDADALIKFESIVRKGIFYDADSDEAGARVSTNLEKMPCPRCLFEVQPNIEHLCGNRADPPRPAASKRKPKASPLSKDMKQRGYK